MSRTAPAIVIALLLVTVLAACTSARQPEPTATSEPFISEPIHISGIGESSTALDAPNGAHALSVRVACSGGQFTLAISPALESERSGVCGGVHKLVLPVESPGKLSLTIWLPEDSRFVAELSFAAEPPPRDDLIAQQCEIMSSVSTILYNADPALAAGDLSAAGWREELDEAAAQLQDVPANGLIGPLFESIRAHLVDLSVPPGEIATSTPRDFRSAQELISRVCSDNGTTVIVQGRYGG